MFNFEGAMMRPDRAMMEMMPVPKLFREEREGGDWRVAMVRPWQELEIAGECHKLGFVSFVPMEFETIKKRGRQVRVERPVIAGYVFVRTSNADWVEINALDGVIRLLNQFGDAPPQKIPTDFMDEWLSRGVVPSTRKVAKMPKGIQTGARIKLMNGVWAKLVTRILSVDKKSRISILMNVFGKDLKVKLPSDVEVEVLD